MKLCHTSSYKLTGCIINSTGVDCRWSFLHGLSFDSRMWEPQYEFFRDEFMTIGIDFRGHGLSDSPDIPYSLDTYVDDVSAVLNALHIPSAMVAGLSLGGAVAVEFSITHPQRTRGLVLVSTALGGYDWSSDWRDTMHQVRNVSTPAELQYNLRKYWLSDPMFAGIRSEVKYARLLRAMAETFSGKPILNGVYEGDEPGETIARLTEVNCPVCIVSGTGDRADFQHIARMLATRVPRADWQPVPNAGHMVNLEASERFNELMEQFLYRVEAEGI